MALTDHKKFKRRTRFLKFWRDQWAVFKTYSWSTDDKTTYYPMVSMTTGECKCTCPWFKSKLAFKIRYSDDPRLCVHLKLAIRNEKKLREKFMNPEPIPG